MRVQIGTYASRLSRIALLVVALPLGAQGRPIPQVYPDGPVVDSTRPEIFRYTQPKVYEKWGREIAACNQLIYPVELARGIKFFAVNAKEMIVDGENGIYGFSSVYRLQIYVVLGEIWSEATIKHELLHWLLLVNGIDQGRNWHTVGYESCGMSRWYTSP